MPHTMTRLPAAVLAGLLVACTASAQSPPAPPPRGLEPPPPGAAPPPPPPPPRAGPGVIIDRGPERALHLDLRCADGDTTRACADLATQLLDKLNGDVQTK